MPDLSRLDDHDAALYGKDPAEGLVALHVVRDRSGREAIPARMRLYWRRGFDQPGGGTVETEDVPFYPFLLIHDAELLRGFGRDRFRYQRLDESVKVEQDRGGQAYFRDLVVFTSVRDYWDAVRHVERVTDTEKRRPDEIYFAGSPEQVYLMQTGRTLFKGMAFEHVHRLQLDIEVYAPEGFPQPERPEHAVIIVALSDNRGWSRLLHARDTSEKALLEETVRLIQERDPDVIEGHNIYGFDFDYLLKRCQLHGVPFAIGRDGSVPRQFPSSMRFAERMVDFPALDIAGRHVVDTLFQVMSFDVFKRDLPGYGLKVAAKYFGFADETRTYVEGSDIARVWDEDPARLLDYALDDVVETERLARHLSGSTFYLTQMVPMPYGQTARTGPASKIEALFVREYLRQRQALPRAAWGSQTIGGYTDVFVTGVVGPVVYADVESLYPSIMLQYDVRPKDDALGVFPDLLRKLTDLRFETKSAMKATDDADARAELDARQTAYKNIINCFSADTEIVTVDGIKPITDVKVGDLVHALNPATLEAEIKPVTAVYEQHYRGPMVSIQNRFTDFLVTPEHRFLTARFKPGGSYGSYTWETASALFDDRVPRKLPPLAPFPPVSAPDLHVSVAALCERYGIIYKRGPRGIKELRQQARWQPNDFALDDWLALLGWYVTEGSLYRSTPKVDANGNVRGESYVISLAQKQEAGCAAIEALLQRTGIAYSTSVNGFSFCSRVFHEVLDAECGSGSFEKRLPDWVFHLPPAHLHVLFDTLMAGDGNATGMRYTTGSAQLARDFVRLCLHLGRRA
ncbi:MAG: 3'-5' exonuclease, partial [Bacteroidota bacterium]